MAQRLGPQLLDRAKHVEPRDRSRRLSRAAGADRERAAAASASTAVDFDLEEHYEDFPPRRFDSVKAWIPVQRGCDYRCTYCIVPTTRGPERSRQLADVVREARETSSPRE